MVDQRKTPLAPEQIKPQMCTLDLRLSILCKLPFLKGLPDPAITAINPLFREQGYEIGEPIYFTGDPAARPYRHLSGVRRGEIPVVNSWMKPRYLTAAS